jgi:hypothetical protein
VSTRPHLLSEGEPIAAQPVDELAELRDELADLQSQIHVLETNYERDRKQIQQLILSLRVIFSGDTEAVPTYTSAPPTGGDRRWDTWISKLGGKQGEFIRALLDHGAMTREQLRISTHSGSSTVDLVLRKLKELSLITKSGDGRWQLKQL